MLILEYTEDNGIGWKHTNWRTGRAVVTRNRELVVQFIITLANYECVSLRLGDIQSRRQLIFFQVHLRLQVQSEWRYRH